MAACNWGQEIRRFRKFWSHEQDIELRIPFNFFNRWGDEIAGMVELLDPVWNRIIVHVLRDDHGGYFGRELLAALRHHYCLSGGVLMFFRLLRPDFMEMRIETAPGVEFVTPQFLKSYLRVIYNN